MPDSLQAPDTPLVPVAVPAAASPPAVAVTPAPAVKSPAENFAQQYDLDEEDTGESEATNALSPAVAATKPAATVPSTPAPKHPKYMLDMAGEFGLAQAEVDALPTDVLGPMLHRLQKQLLAHGREDTIAQTISDAVGNRTTAAAATPPAEPAAAISAAAPPAEIDPFKFKDEDYDPDVLALLRQQHKTIKELKEQVGQVGGFVQQAQAERQQSTNQRIDSVFAKHEDRLGKGTGVEMPKDSAEFARRMAVLGEAQRDKSHRSLEERIEGAIERLYGKAAVVTPAAENLTELQKKWLEGGVAAPTQRNTGAEPPSVSKARKSVAEKMKEIQAESGATDSDDEKAGFL